MEELQEVVFQYKFSILLEICRDGARQKKFENRRLKPNMIDPGGPGGWSGRRPCPISALSLS